MAIDLQKFIGKFIEESREHLQLINNCLLILEVSPDDPETLDKLFRATHTIKGSSKILKLSVIGDTLHKIEDVFDAFRSGTIPLNDSTINILFEGFDFVETALNQIENGADQASIDAAAITKDLEDAAAGQVKEIREPSPEKTPAATPENETIIPSSEKKETIKKEVELISQTESDTRDLGSDPATQNSDYSSEEKVKEKKDEAETTTEMLEEKSVKQSKNSSKESSAQKDGQASSKPEKSNKKAVPETAKPVKGESIRISIDRLDELIKLMGEIVSNQNRLKHRLSNIRNIEKLSHAVVERALTIKSRQAFLEKDNELFFQPIQKLHQDVVTLSSNTRDDINIQDLLTNELQDKALKLRMMPLSTIFDTFPRSVRDLSRSLNKKVKFSVSGGETELDKKIIERLGDPLMHMIRNAIDHGVETPEVRKQAGKSELGAVSLSAFYEGGAVVITLQDDGAGISTEKLKDKAREKGLFDQNTLDNMSKSEIIDLIFHPGFSTTEKVTDISGRGVGMDVVKRNIVLDLKGSIQIESEHKKGSTFYIRLPLTLSILSVLLVEVGMGVFALSSSAVNEILRIKASSLVEIVNRKAIKLRGQLIPTVYLEKALQIKSSVYASQESYLVIIVHIGNDRLGLIVDSLLNEEDMVIKPLPTHMKENKWVTGVAITGSNELVNVLHVPTIFEYSKNVLVSMEDVSEKIDIASEEIKVLLVDDSVHTLEMEKAILESYGYNVETAHDGKEALIKAMEKQFDIVITDINMPNMDGLTLTKRLRSKKKYKETPIIMVSAKEGDEDRKKGIQVGADAYITKSNFGQEEFLNTIQGLV